MRHLHVMVVIGREMPKWEDSNLSNLSLAEISFQGDLVGCCMYANLKDIVGKSNLSSKK